MNVEARIDAGLCMLQRIANPGLDRNGLQARQVQQFLPAHPAQTLVHSRRADLFSKRFIRLTAPHHLEVAALAVGLHLAGGMRMADPNLGDPDLFSVLPTSKGWALHRASGHRRSTP